MSGEIKVHNGTVFNWKPIKVWNGSAWVVKPLKFWNGTEWKLTNNSAPSIPLPITVDYYPLGGYPSNDLQEWYFYPSVKGHKISFSINSIDTEANFDIIQVSEFAIPIYTTGQSVLQTYSGTSLGVAVESSIGFRVRFKSDPAVNGTGFSFTITESVGGSLPLTSLKYPLSGNYPSNDLKIWCFENCNINFTAFATEAGYDFLKIYEVNGNVAPTLLYNLSGTSLPASFSNSKRILIYFHSDASTENSGFEFTATNL